MSVGELIKQLKKYPKTAVVVWQDHDQSAHEYNNVLGRVEDGTEDMRQDFKGKPVVVLGP